MKANAPEKLYISDYGSEVRYNWHPERLAVKDIEYIRTDAFIEKACEVDLEHLEQEVKDFCYKFDDRKDKWYDMTPHDKNIMISPTWSNFAMQLAKHFFELGMAVNNKLVKGVDLDKEAEWIANGIMIAVKSAKLHTNVYNPDRKDYDHSHLMQAARRGIELGLKIAQKGEEV